MKELIKKYEAALLHITKEGECPLEIFEKCIAPLVEKLPLKTGGNGYCVNYQDREFVVQCWDKYFEKQALIALMRCQHEIILPISGQKWCELLSKLCEGKGGKWKAR